MRRQDILSILLTFVMGFGVGVYVYIAGVASFFSTVSVPEASEELSYVVVADAYGGCSRGSTCPSFRVDSTGSYRYIFPAGRGEEQVTRDGRLPYGMRQELDNVLTARALASQSQAITPATCDSYVDGIDVKYTVQFEGAEYELNSCGTAVDADSQLWRALSGLWDYLETN